MTVAQVLGFLTLKWVISIEFVALEFSTGPGPGYCGHLGSKLADGKIFVSILNEYECIDNFLKYLQAGTKQTRRVR